MIIIIEEVVMVKVNKFKIIAILCTCVLCGTAVYNIVRKNNSKNSERAVSELEENIISDLDILFANPLSVYENVSASFVAALCNNACSLLREIGLQTFTMFYTTDNVLYCSSVDGNANYELRLNGEEVIFKCVKD